MSGPFFFDLYNAGANYFSQSSISRPSGSLIQIRYSLEVLRGGHQDVQDALSSRLHHELGNLTSLAVLLENNCPVQ